MYKKEENKIRFTPYAWAKLVYLRDKGNTEVAGFGISSIEDPLLVKDFYLIKQTASAASFEFDNDGFADFVEDMIDKGFEPAEFQRILIHTHPGTSPIPSSVDESNFSEKLSDCSWSIMFILAKEGQTYCALKYKSPNCRFEIKTEIDCNAEFSGSDHTTWDKEYENCIVKKSYTFDNSSNRYSYYSKEYEHSYPNEHRTFKPSSENWYTKQTYGLPKKELNPRYRFSDDGGFGIDNDYPLE